MLQAFIILAVLSATLPILIFLLGWDPGILIILAVLSVTLPILICLLGWDPGIS